MSSKKDKTKKQLSPDATKEMQEAYLKEAQAYKERVLPLVRFLKSKNLRFNNALVGRERIEYFRLDQLDKLLEQNKEAINADQKLLQLVKNYAQEFVYFKRPENIKIKYPKILQHVPDTHPQKKYASFRFDTTESKKGMTILVISLVLAAVLFPIWPYSVKYGIWLVSLALLVIMVGIIIVRLIVYLLISIFNYHIWIFPNLFYSNGILESFIPVVQITKGDSSWFNLFLRLFAISAFILLSVHIYLNPTFLDQNLYVARETVMDVHDWGVGKLKNQKNFAQRALTNLQEILNQTEDAKAQQYPQDHRFQNTNEEEAFENEIPLDNFQNSEYNQEQNEVPTEEI